MAFPLPPKINKTYSQVNVNIPARLQWNRNGGYCGETSVIIAGMLHGQYLSQFDMRTIASPGMPQNSQSYPGIHTDPNAYYNAQLLLGQNAARAVAGVKLQQASKTSADSMKFLQWVKLNVAKGNQVIIGVLNNVNMLGEGGTGDSQYDHILSVVGYGSDQPLNSAAVQNDDIIMLMDNGLYTPNGNNNIPYFYQFTISKFLKSRTQANNGNQIYSLLQLPKNQNKKGGYLKNNFGMVITGVMDPKNETLPVTVTDNAIAELPKMESDGCLRPAANNITLTITVSGLAPGKQYNLYLYKDETLVPASDFKKNSGKPWKTFSVKSGSTKTYTLNAKSSDKLFFRAVPA